LTVTVTPGTNPPSAGITVTGNLTGIGGSASQTFYDDGATAGDLVAGDNVFSYSATVVVGTTAGNKNLPFTVADDFPRSSSGSIALTVNPPLVAIHDIQGSGSTSPLAGQLVATIGVVTGVKSNGFFIQSKIGFEDADPNTSEGVFVFTSSAPPGGAVVGNEVKVAGTVQEFIPSADIHSPPTTEIGGSPTLSVLSSGNPLPAPITLTASDTSPTGSIEQLEKYEGMRVHVDSLTVIAPTQGTINEASATSASNGVFYGVITGVARPFREPGVETPDPLPAGSPCCVPTFDANPERLRVDSDGLAGSTPIEVTTGAVVTNLTGPLDYAFRTYTIDPEPATVPVVTGNISAIPVPVPASNEFTVASFNTERFFDTTNDPSVDDVVLTATAFNNRLNKASLAIRNVLRVPDILGVEEMENLAALQELAGKVNSDAVAAGQANPNYQAYLAEGNDIGGIDVGFLVKGAPRVNVIDVTQYNKDETYIDPNTGDPALLNDRPSLILRAAIQPPVGSPYPITVIVNHLRSLSGVDDPADGNRVRTKRRAQAESLANLIQARQTADPNERIVLVGDFNAFQVNDGYVDTIGTIIGTPTPCDEVVLCSADLVNPDLVDLVNTVPAADRYSYSFDGNAQVLDHELMTQNLLPRFDGLHYARNDADFPESFRNDSNRPERISDHDIPVVYFNFPPQITALSPANVWVGLKNSDDVGI
jgi:predicted extracellular nuclease